jgi:hypothetical protein
MIIHFIKEKASSEQITDMLQAFEEFIKLAVDIEQEILAGGGSMHADCEEVLLQAGSAQENIWGADWTPAKRQVDFDSLINIRPQQNNPSMTILDESIRNQVERITRKLLEQP